MEINVDTNDKIFSQFDEIFDNLVFDPLRDKDLEGMSIWDGKEFHSGKDEIKRWVKDTWKSTL